jgi:hypothetical protein
MRNQKEILLETGSGKTLAFLLPLLRRVVVGRSSVQTLVVVPTWEMGLLAVRVARRLGARASASGPTHGPKLVGRAVSRSWSTVKIFLQNAKKILIETQIDGEKALRCDECAIKRRFCLMLQKNTTMTESFYNVIIIFRQRQKNCTATETCNKQKILNWKKRYNNQPLCGGEHS